jgi:hypothetical protein
LGLPSMALPGTAVKSVQHFLARHQPNSNLQLESKETHADKYLSFVS